MTSGRIITLTNRLELRDFRDHYQHADDDALRQTESAYRLAVGLHRARGTLHLADICRVKAAICRALLAERGA
jgi:hypothetical protein